MDLYATVGPIFFVLFYRLVQKFIANMKFNVEFSFNRYPLKCQHRAVQLAAKHRLGDVLFPTDSGDRQAALPNLRSPRYNY